MKFLIKPVLLFLQLFAFSIAFGQNGFWSDISESSIRTGGQKQLIVPEKARTLALNLDQLKAYLATVPLESAANASRQLLAIPMPDGGYQNFAIVETPMMEPSLAAAVPGIKTYTGQGIEDPSASIKIDVTLYGFHAMILSPEQGGVFIDPYSRGSVLSYISYYRKDYKSDQKLIETAYREIGSTLAQRGAGTQAPAPICVGTTLMTYRLAVACTGEYAAALGAVTKDQALSAIVTSVNRVNGIYERELAIRLILVANNLKVVFISAALDPFTGNNNANVLINESQKVITDSIGSANFDIGHTFSTGAGGLAGIGVVCRNSFKANGVTGSSVPKNDAFDVDYVAHEIGHQFGASHTFNAATNSCLDNGDVLSNVEPGSGSTIMAYAGICGINDLQLNSDPYFHTISLRQIRGYIASLGASNCAVVTNTSNAAPVVNAGADYTIPKSTPFMLTGSATDANNDPLTYSWEQIDIGGPFGNTSSPVGLAPIFRSFTPSSSATRVFPRLSSIVNNSSTLGELLPSYGRTLEFSLTARDNKAGGGGVCADDVKLTVDDNSGPFVVTAPNTATTWVVGSYQTITWDVAGTNVAPVSVANVSIQLSTDGGFTYPITLVAFTPNDGIHEIIVPANVTTSARIRVMAIGNVFFDISNANFTIQSTSTPDFVFNNPEQVVSCTGTAAPITVKTAALAGFNGTISLSASGNPAGTTVVFSSPTVNPGNNVTVTLQGAALSGSYNFSVTGISGSSSKSLNLSVFVGMPITSATLNAPAENAINQSVTPFFTWSPVPGATSYNFQLASDNTFTTDVRSVNAFPSTKYVLGTPLSQGTVYYWRVAPVNACGVGPVSSTNAFRTFIDICSTANSTDVPKLIPDTVSSISSNLIISNGAIITDINVVGLRGTHSYINDIGMYLQSPGGTTITLFDDICGEEDNFNLNLDDEALTATIPCPPVGGVTVQPQEPLANFKGQSSLGRWVLFVEDYVDGDGGILTGWGLRICTPLLTPLPVNWLSFTGQKNANNTVALQWSTANETNNTRYEVQRSADGINFEMLGDVPGGNNPTMMQQYYYTDLKPFTGVSFYRLKQIDADGKFSYSALVQISIEGARQAWAVYPNPAKDQSTVRILSEMTKVNISLSDGSGKQVYRKYLPSAKNGEMINLPLNTLAKGIYLLTVETGSVRRTEKLLVQ